MRTTLQTLHGSQMMMAGRSSTPHHVRRKCPSSALLLLHYAMIGSRCRNKCRTEREYAAVQQRCSARRLVMHKSTSESVRCKNRPRGPVVPFASYSTRGVTRRLDRTTSHPAKTPEKGRLGLDSVEAIASSGKESYCCSYIYLLRSKYL